MTEEQVPWYKRWWVTLAALVLGILGGIAAVVGKTLLSKKAVTDQQRTAGKILEERLADKQAVGDAKLEAVNAKTDAAKVKADADLKEKTNALADKAKADAAKNAGSPDAASDALDAALSRANRPATGPTRR